MSTTAKILMLIAFGLVAVVVSPLITIWSLNTLFTLSVAYTAKNWLAALLLSGTIGGSAKLASGSR